MQEPNDVPPEIRDLAESCVRFVEKAVGVAPDFTQDTLPLVDHYLGIEENVADDVLALVVPAVGAYFGEVLRHHLGGTWNCPTEDYTGWELTFSGTDLKVQPIVAAFEAAKKVTEKSDVFVLSPENKKIAESALEEFGQVQERDFATLSVRFEVAELLLNKLRPTTKADKDLN